MEEGRVVMRICKKPLVIKTEDPAIIALLCADLQKPVSLFGRAWMSVSYMLTGCAHVGDSKAEVFLQEVEFIAEAPETDQDYRQRIVTFLRDVTRSFEAGLWKFHVFTADQLSAFEAAGEDLDKIGGRHGIKRNGGAFRLGDRVRLIKDHYQWGYVEEIGERTVSVRSGQMSYVSCPSLWERAA